MDAAEFLRTRFRTLAGPDGRLAGRFDELLTEGRLLLLLDGLDELPGRSIGDRRVRSLRALADTAGLRCGFVLACRDQDYAGAGALVYVWWIALLVVATVVAAARIGGHRARLTRL